MKKIFKKEYLIEQRKCKIDADWASECDGKLVDENNQIGIWSVHDTWCIFVDDNNKKYRLIEIEEE